MKIEIVNQKDNALFSRKEIEGLIESNVTPRREEVLEALSNELGVQIDNIKIKGIHGSFGSNKFNIEANIYSSKEDKEKIEPKKKKEKAYEDRLKEEAAASEEKTEEKPKEEETKEAETKPEVPATEEEKPDKPELEQSEEKIEEINKEAKEKEKGEPEKEQ